MEYNLEDGKWYLIINNYPFPIKKSAMPALMDVNAPIFQYKKDEEEEKRLHDKN